jgi:hypothetical protein
MPKRSGPPELAEGLSVYPGQWNVSGQARSNKFGNVPNPGVVLIRSATVYRRVPHFASPETTLLRAQRGNQREEIASSRGSSQGHEQAQHVIASEAWQSTRHSRGTCEMWYEGLVRGLQEPAGGSPAGSFPLWASSMVLDSHPLQALSAHQACERSCWRLQSGKLPPRSGGIGLSRRRYPDTPDRPTALPAIGR